MKYGAEFPWADDKDKITYPCSDPENLVMFKIKRENRRINLRVFEKVTDNLSPHP
jgi:hypothetical protein